MGLIKLWKERIELGKKLAKQGEILIMDVAHVAVHLYQFALLLISFIYSLEELVDEAEGALKKLRKAVKSK